MDLQALGVILIFPINVKVSGPAITIAIGRLTFHVYEQRQQTLQKMTKRSRFELSQYNLCILPQNFRLLNKVIQCHSDPPFFDLLCQTKHYFNTRLHKKGMF